MTDLTDKMVGCQDGEVEAFRNLLQDAEVSNQAIISAGKLQYQNRPEKLINAMFQRVYKIPVEIEMQDKDLASQVRNRTLKVEKLIKDGFSDNEINKICPEISQEYIDSVATKKIELADEKIAIQAFLGDTPEFRLELLPEYLVLEYQELNGELIAENA